MEEPISERPAGQAGTDKQQEKAKERLLKALHRPEPRHTLAGQLKRRRKVLSLLRDASRPAA
ncbi:MAG: hypothetical protein ACYC66_15370 [Chloroflexota bacterium]